MVVGAVWSSAVTDTITEGQMCGALIVVSLLLMQPDQRTLFLDTVSH